MIPKKYIPVVIIVISVFLLLNTATLMAALSIHPNGFHGFLAAAVLGNLFWFFFPRLFRRKSTPFLRWIRALFAPAWAAWTFFMILYTSFVLVLDLAWAMVPFFHQAPFKVFAYTWSRYYLMILGAMALIGVFQALVTWQVPRIKVRISKLPREFNGFKIALLSDLHVGLFTPVSRLRHFSRVVENLHPNLVAVCGDMTDDDPFFVRKFLKGIQAIRPRLPLVAILGNHDIYGDPFGTLQALKRGRVKVLVNQGFAICRKGKTLWVAGLSDYAALQFKHMKRLYPRMDKALKNKPKGAVTVLLAHQPKAFIEAARRHVELTLSGHTHGGQFGLRFLNWCLAKPFTRFPMGLFKKGKSRLYVSTGTGYWVLPIRFGLPPEIALIELESAA